MEPSERGVAARDGVSKQREVAEDELGNTIANFARIVPDGLLVFFPSYGVMDMCVGRWRETGIWDRIARFKHPVVEPRGSSPLSRRSE